MATRDSRPCPGSASLRAGDTPGSRVPQNPPGATSVPPDPPGPSRPPRARRRLRSSSGARSPCGERRPEGRSSPIVLLHDVTNVTAAPAGLPSLRDKPKTIRVITRDLIRELIIPRDRPPASLIIGTDEFQRIREEAQPPRQLRDRLRILKSRQDAAFEQLRRARSAELGRDEQQDKDKDRDRDRDKDKEEEGERARKISGPSSPIVQLRDVRSAPGPVPQDKPKTIRVFTKDVVRELVIPRDRPPASLIIGTDEFQRIREEAQPPRQLGDRLRILKSRQDAAFVGISCFPEPQFPSSPIS
ncbi:cilia- and flagella-associated protein 45-like [Molothrus aeneus]|uniref:cilia- and flagella-associated protein 45-like n=1 Tax=Molothrus aeneus TaxID=84833 RepID=UPI0034595FD6